MLRSTRLFGLGLAVTAYLLPREARASAWAALLDEARPYLRSVVGEAERTGVPATVVLCQIEAESGYDPYDVSHVNARGLMQVIDGPFEPARNIAAGVEELRAKIVRSRGSLYHALAAYAMGGAGARRAWQRASRYPANVDRYARRILRCAGLPVAARVRVRAGAVTALSTVRSRTFFGASTNVRVTFPGVAPHPHLAPVTRAVLSELATRRLIAGARIVSLARRPSHQRRLLERHRERGIEGLASSRSLHLLGAAIDLVLVRRRATWDEVVRVARDGLRRRGIDAERVAFKPEPQLGDVLHMQLRLKPAELELAVQRLARAGLLRDADASVQLARRGRAPHIDDYVARR